MIGRRSLVSAAGQVTDAPQHPCRCIDQGEGSATSVQMSRSFCCGSGIDANGVRVVIVESADRFARKMLTAELGILLLITRGVTLITAMGEDLTDTDDEMRVAFRQMAMTFAQLEKTRLVKKLRVARDRASVKAGRRIEGKKGYTRGDPELVALAKSIWLEGRTLRATSQLLAERGYVTRDGKPFAATQVKRLVEAG